MSNCRDSYCNYGSYLRSRGYDKQICKLVDDIENGNINNGAVNPNSNGNGAVVNGSLIVKSTGQANPPVSNSRMQEGLIYSFGGQLGSSGEFINNHDLGMQMYKGTRINGPIIQTANNSHVKATAQGSSVVTHVNTNIFKGDTHIFTNDGANTNVIIKGNLSFDGSLVQLPDTIETSLTLQAPATHDNEMLTIFHGATEAQGFDIVDVWIDGSGNIVPPSGPTTGTKTWLQRLAFSIDGDLSANQFTTGGFNGATAVHGHTRILRGATVLNPCNDPSTDNTIDISYSLNDISDVALDVYGRVRVFEGPTYNGLVKSAPEIDLSGSSVNAAKISMYNDGSLTLNLNANDGIISGNSSGDGIKIRDVSNIRFLDNTEIFVGNSLDISSEKVEFLGGDVHVVENLSVSGNIVSTGTLSTFTEAAINNLVAGGTSGSFISNSNSQFKQNVGISGDLIVDQQVGINGDLTVFGTLNGGLNVDINGGAIDGTAIGANSTSTGAFTTLTANSASISTITSAALTNPTISGGTIDSATIGASTPNTGAFTTLSATSLSAPAPATLGITGNLTGNVTGNLTGDVTGDVTGDLTGDVTGNVTGNVTGDVTGTLQTAAQPNITTVNKDLVLGASTSSVNEVASITLGGTNTRRFSVDSDPVTGQAVFGTSSRQLPINLKGGNGATDVVLKNSNGTGTLLMETSGPASGLRVPKFGLGVTPAGPVISSSGDNKPSTSSGSLLILKEDDTWDGGFGSTEYNLNDIVRALKQVGILKQ